MIKLNCLPGLLILLLFAGSIHAQGRKLDTTVKLNDVGFRVICNNKNEDENNVTISPVGLRSSTQRDINFSVQGRVTKAIIDDLNEDGNPGLVLCIFAGA